MKNLIKIFKCQNFLILKISLKSYKNVNPKT